MINIVHIVRLYIEMFDFMVSVVHPSEVPNVMYMMPHTVHLMAKVVHQGSLGKGT